MSRRPACYCCCPAAQLVIGTSHFKVNKSSPPTTRVTLHAEVKNEMYRPLPHCALRKGPTQTARGGKKPRTSFHKKNSADGRRRRSTKAECIMLPKGEMEWTACPPTLPLSLLSPTKEQQTLLATKCSGLRDASAYPRIYQAIPPRCPRSAPPLRSLCCRLYRAQWFLMQDLANNVVRQARKGG